MPAGTVHVPVPAVIETMQSLPLITPDAVNPETVGAQFVFDNAAFAGDTIPKIGETKEKTNAKATPRDNTLERGLKVDRMIYLRLRA